MVIVRPNLDRSRTDKTILAGVGIKDRVLQGTVVAIGPKVTEDIQVNDEVIFRRPEGDPPELAFMDADLILATLEIPTYG
jgi:co-chaperonin GroES (HSP10)